MKSENKKVAIGLDIGGTNIKYGLVDPFGKIIYESIQPTRMGNNPDSVINSIISTISEARTFCLVKELDLKGIGIGVPALVYNGVLSGCSGNLPEMEGVDLQKILEQHFTIPIKLENDANAMAIAECIFGEAQGLTDIIFLTIGTGIGGAMVLNGKLYGGYRNRGTEFGHLSIDLNGPLCTCGAKGCLESLASITALIQSYKILFTDLTQLPERVDGRYIVKKYLEGQIQACETMNHHFEYLAAGIAGLINIFSPQKIILGGGITESGSFYIHEIRKRTLALAMKETSTFTLLEVAKLGNKAGFLGSSALIFEQ